MAISSTKMDRMWDPKLILGNNKIKDNTIQIFTVFCFLPSHHDHHRHHSLQCYLFIFVLHQISMDVVRGRLDLTAGTQRTEIREG